MDDILFAQDFDCRANIYSKLSRLLFGRGLVEEILVYRGQQFHPYEYVPADVVFGFVDLVIFYSDDIRAVLEGVHGSDLIHEAIDYLFEICP